MFIAEDFALNIGPDHELMIPTGPGFDLGDGHRGICLDFQLALRLHAEHELLDGGVLAFQLLLDEAIRAGIRDIGEGKLLHTLRDVGPHALSRGLASEVRFLR